MPKTSAPKKVQHVVALPPYLHDYVEGLASHHQESVSVTIKRCVEAMAEADLPPKRSALEQAIITYIDQHYADGVAHGKALRAGMLGRYIMDDRGNQHMLQALYASVKLPIVGSFDEISTTLDLALKTALSIHVAELESLGATHFLNGRAFRTLHEDGPGRVMFVTYYIAEGDQTA